MKIPNLSVFVCFLALLGCAPTLSRIEKGPIVGYGDLADHPTYHSLRLDLERRGDMPVPVFCVQLDDGVAPIRSDRLSPDYVARYLPTFRIPSYWPDTWREKAKSYEQYEGNGYFIAFRDGRIAYISLGMRESDPVEPVTRPSKPAKVGPKDCGRLYELPITREAFVEIFGLPDKEYGVREVRY